MAIKFVTFVQQAAVYDGTNSAEMITVANLTGFGPFTVKSEQSNQLVITSRGWDVTFQLGYVMIGTSVLTPAEFAGSWAEVTPISVGSARSA